MSRVGEPVTVLAMMHAEHQAEIISNVMQYAAPCRADKARKGRMIGALGDKNEKGEASPLANNRKTRGNSATWREANWN